MMQKKINHIAMMCESVISKTKLLKKYMYTFFLKSLTYLLIL